MEEVGQGFQISQNFEFRIRVIFYRDINFLKFALFKKLSCKEAKIQQHTSSEEKLCTTGEEAI